MKTNKPDSPDDCASYLLDPMLPLTFQDAARILRVNEKVVEKLCRVQKEIPFVRIGGRRFIRLSDLTAYIQRGGTDPDGALDEYYFNPATLKRLVEINGILNTVMNHASNALSEKFKGHPDIEANLFFRRPKRPDRRQKT